YALGAELLVVERQFQVAPRHTGTGAQQVTEGDGPAKFLVGYGEARQHLDHRGVPVDNAVIDQAGDQQRCHGLACRADHHVGFWCDRLTTGLGDAEPGEVHDLTSLSDGDGGSWDAKCVHRVGDVLLELWHHVGNWQGGRTAEVDGLDGRDLETAGDYLELRVAPLQHAQLGVHQHDVRVTCHHLRQRLIDLVRIADVVVHDHGPVDAQVRRRFEGLDRLQSRAGCRELPACCDGGLDIVAWRHHDVEV